MLKKTAKNIGNNYLKKSGKYYHGITLLDVNQEYCEPVEKTDKDGKEYLVYEWAGEVYKCMRMIVR